MIVTKTMTLRPSAKPFKNTASYFKEEYSDYYTGHITDEDETTRADYGDGDLYFTFRNIIDLSPRATITSVKICIYGNRTDSSSNVAYKVNLVYGDDYSNPIKMFSADLVPSLVPYYSSNPGKDTRYVTQTLTEAQSRAFLTSLYPGLYLYNKGSIHYYEVYVEVTYDIEESVLFLGSNAVSSVYVGSTKASAVYIGTTKIL